MGRKIPGRKHRGIKDPFEQEKKRFERIANKINAPPISEDEQAVPKSLLRIISLKSEAKKKLERKKSGKKKNAKLTEQIIPPAIKGPGRFKQSPIENAVEFYARTSVGSQQVLSEVKHQTKFNAKFERNPARKITVVKDAKDKYFLDDSTDKTAKTLLYSKGKNKKGRKSSTLTKHEKLRAKKIAKKEAREELEMGPDFNQFTDEVMFGEVVHQPPELKALISGRNRTSQKKPGCRDLLLKAVLQSPATAHNPASANSAGRRSHSRPAPSAARQRELEAERQRVVEAYRLLKARRGHTGHNDII